MIGIGVLTSFALGIWGKTRKDVEAEAEVAGSAEGLKEEACELE